MHYIIQKSRWPESALPPPPPRRFIPNAHPPSALQQHCRAISVPLPPRLATPTRNTHSLSISFSSATTPLLLPALWAIFTFLALTEMNDLVWGAVRGASTKLRYTLSSILSILSKLATLPHPVYSMYVRILRSSCYYSSSPGNTASATALSST